MADNAITVVGNVTRDPELKFLNSGQAALRLSVAVNRRWQNRQTQEWEERVAYFEVVGLRRPGGERRELAREGCARHRDRSTRAAHLGDRERRQAFDRRDQRRRDRAQPQVGDRRRHAHPARRGQQLQSSDRPAAAPRSNEPSTPLRL